MEIRIQRRNKCLQELCKGKELTVEERDRFFPAKQYSMGILRKNGLPSRFSMGAEPVLYDTISNQVAIYGRDDQEELFFVPIDLLEDGNIHEYLLRQYRIRRDEAAYYTILYYRKPFFPEEMSLKINHLYRSLGSQLVIGRTQVLEMESLSDVVNWSQSHAGYLLSQLLSSLDYLLERHNTEDLEKKLRFFYHQCSTESTPQYWLETASGRILERLQEKKRTRNREEWHTIMEDYLKENLARDMRQETLERITADYGTQLRMNRSIQAEGSFAVVKEEMNFRRYLTGGKKTCWPRAFFWPLPTTSTSFILRSGEAGQASS